MGELRERELVIGWENLKIIINRSDKTRFVYDYKQIKNKNKKIWNNNLKPTSKYPLNCLQHLRNL